MGERKRPRIGPGEQQQVVDEAGEMRHLGIDVVEGLGLLAQGHLGLAAQVLDRAAHHGQRGAQFVARVGGEFALPAQGPALRGERIANGTSARSA